MEFIMEAMLSGIISKAINNFADVSWNKIKEADKNRKSKEQNLQTRIYQIIVDTINNVTYNKYKDQDILYNAAENLLNNFNKNGFQIKSVKKGLSNLISPIDDDKAKEFIGELCSEICKENNNIYDTITLMQSIETNEYNHQEFHKLQELLAQVIEKLDNKETIAEKNIEIKKYQKRHKKSRTQEYATKWNQNMFLNDFDKRAENAGVNVKLSEVYLDEHLPHYIFEKNQTPYNDLKTLLSEYIYLKTDNKMLLILGQPGIGKSTLITWITANFSNNIDDILVYKFASDLGGVDWQDGRITNRILEKLCLDYQDLNEKILILDGFDEISIDDNRRRDILDSLYGDWIYSNVIENFSLIITCRENYIPEFAILKCKYITLCPWDREQIESFSNIFQKKTKNKITTSTLNKLVDNKEILGIPLLLYMVLALNISIDQEGSLVDVYDKVFSLEGGIYKRCIDNKNFGDEHRISHIKEQIHQISREIAIWMFENQPAYTYIPKKEYQKICNTVVHSEQKSEEIPYDFMIGNYFKLIRHCEGIDTEILYFTHRSIYEYFVAETIYSSIENAMLKLTDESQEELAGKIVKYIKQGMITYTIGEYLQFKLLKLYNSLDVYKKVNFYQWWEKAVEKMMEYGMLYYTGSNIKDYPSILDKEILCFYNLIKILKLLHKTGTRKYILENADKEQLEKYIRLRLVMCSMEARYGTEVFSFSKIYLAGINLSDADFRHANLNDANLRGANLRGANFEGMRLLRTDFRGADLSNANLIDTNLVTANLEDANLQDANFTGTLFAEYQINYLRKKYDLQGAYVNIVKTNKAVSYEEYCAEYQ